MRRIALHEYLSQIEGLLDDNRLPEAATHCHYVLQQFPRHIGTYRLFGRALLEQQLYEEAVDIFERLLSADPEDLVSHAGLALAYGESRDLERAIWHMERAFELDPYNRAVQDELRKLYLARNGDAPPRLTLTRAALARLHIRAALYRQGFREFARLIAEYPERTDLKLAMAEACYLDSRPNEAAELCRQLLVTLPFCVKANAILADLLLREERVDEARDFLRRVQSLTMLDRAHLNPDTTLGRALSNARISLPEIVQVEVLEDALTFSRESTGKMSWSDLSTAVLVDGEDVPDWLHEIGSPDSVAEYADPTVSVVVAETEMRELVDWLDEAADVEIGERPEELDDVFDEFPETPSDDEASVLSQPDLNSEISGVTSGALVDAASTDDLLSSVPEEQTVPDDTSALKGDSPAEMDEAGSFQVTGTGVQQEISSAKYVEEPLLGLEDLRAHIDNVDDVDPAISGTEAPEWLDELSERPEDMVELPSWLHEAVGLEASDSAANDLSDSITPEADVGQEAEKRRDPIDGVLSPDGLEQPGTLSDEITQETMELEGDVPELEETSVPDWLLEADDVLEELPASVFRSATRTGIQSDNTEDVTATWLDELTAQLSELNEPGEELTGEPSGSSDDDQFDATAGPLNQ